MSFRRCFCFLEGSAMQLRVTVLCACMTIRIFIQAQTSTARMMRTLATLAKFAKIQIDQRAVGLMSLAQRNAETSQKHRDFFHNIFQQAKMLTIQTNFYKHKQNHDSTNCSFFEPISIFTNKINFFRAINSEKAF